MTFDQMLEEMVEAVVFRVLGGQQKDIFTAPEAADYLGLKTSYVQKITGKPNGLAKLTGPANAAHIHIAAKGKSGAIVVPLCGPCTSGVTGTATSPQR
jgi:hypothetical protein